MYEDESGSEENKNTLTIIHQGVPTITVITNYGYNFAQRAFARFTFLLIG
jgi:hypothetical protein